MDPLDQPAAAAAAPPAAAAAAEPPAAHTPTKKRKPLNMSEEAVQRRERMRLNKENKEEFEDIVDTLQTLYTDRIEDILRKDNKRAFEIVLRNRNFGNRNPELTDTKLVELLFQHDAVKCMKKLGPYDKYNQTDHFADIDIDLIMDPNHRNIVAEFLWGRQSNVLLLSYAQTVENDEVLIGGSNMRHGSDVVFRSRTILKLLERTGPTVKQRVSFLRDMLARMPFSSDDLLHYNNIDNIGRLAPSKHERMLQCLWTEIKGNDWEDRVAEGQLLEHTILEALSDHAVEWWTSNVTADRADLAPFRQAVSRVHLQRATTFFTDVAPVLEPIVQEKFLVAEILSFLNTSIDSAIHCTGSPALLKGSPSRVFYLAARKEAKRNEAVRKERFAAHKAACKERRKAKKQQREQQVIAAAHAEMFASRVSDAAADSSSAPMELV